MVWAHNSHIGDARFTEMGAVREELNIGQLCREKLAEAATLIGFGTHAGTVAAASDWDGDMEVMQVRPSRPDSYDRQFHDAGVARGLLNSAATKAFAVACSSRAWSVSSASSIARTPGCIAITRKRHCPSSSMRFSGSTERTRSGRWDRSIAASGFRTPSD